jgi:hypothetical protein
VGGEATAGCFTLNYYSPPPPKFNQISAYAPGIVLSAQLVGIQISATKQVLFYLAYLTVALIGSRTFVTPKALP